MEIRSLLFEPDAPAMTYERPFDDLDAGWVWIDIEAGPDDLDAMATMADGLGLDALAVRDAVEDLEKAVDILRDDYGGEQ